MPPKDLQEYPIRLGRYLSTHYEGNTIIFYHHAIAIINNSIYSASVCKYFHPLEIAELDRQLYLSEGKTVFITEGVLMPYSDVRIEVIDNKFVVCG
jgi:hypothetical protein